MSYDDVVDLVGKQYGFRATGPEAYDCITLVAEVYRRHGRTLPMPEGYTCGSMSEYELLTWSRRFRRLSGPKHLAVVDMDDTHIGVCVDEKGGWRILHASSRHGVVVQKLPRLEHHVVGYYEPLDVAP